MSERDGTKYIGFTKKLKQRLDEHNAGTSQYTKGHRPYRCIWYGAFQSKALALAFERYLKSSSGFAFTKKHLI